MDIDGWLRGIGLPQYAETFRANDIDVELLGRLSNDDLKEIGVTSFGHRKKLLEAIAALARAFPASAEPAIEPRASDAAERRQLTVMFCDLVGSTALSARLDPEDMRGIIGAYHGCCAACVERHGGFVAKYMGDGVLAYFGYPRAHEHDAEHAVQAGLDIVEAAPRLVTASGAPLRVRVGIATGLVVVGDLRGSGEAQERGVVGETPNLAARLQAIADPDTVVIAEGTRRLLGNLFVLEDLGALDLKGVGPVHAWAARQSSAVESRFEALHATDLTALVGRDEEMELLLRRWSEAQTGQGQVALLSGEAGIGKSRLTVALLERLATEQHTRLRYFCSPQHTDSALHPIIGQLERASGFAQDDGLGAKLDKLDAMLAQTSTSVEDAALFAEMLSLPNDGRYPALGLQPEQRRQRTFVALVSQVEALTRQNPVLMIFEDAHWTDPTSLDAFGWTVDRIAGLRALLIVTFRPEFEPPWIGRPHVTSLTLNRLPRPDIDAIIDGVAGNKSLPAGIRHEIIERTDGIPLFIEEMTKTVLEAEGEGEARRLAAAVPSVPPSLHASLMARLDRLGAAKEVAQVAGAIGREFSHSLLAAASLKPEAELRSALDRLIAAGLLFRRGTPPHSTYLFKHSLVQDAAYGTLLRDTRRALHARIAEAIENQFPEIAERQPELLARHCAEAGLREKAALLWGRAGLRSVERSALVEATEQFTRALDEIAALPATPALRREQIRLQVALLLPLGHIKGFAAPEVEAAVERARELIEQAEAIGEPVEDPSMLFSVLQRSWTAKWSEFDGDAMRALAAQFLALAEKQATTFPLFTAHRLMGISLTHTGDPAEARARFDRALALYDPVAHRPLAARFGSLDPWVTALLGRAWALWLLGSPDSALRDAESALAAAREIGQGGTLWYALGHNIIVQLLCRQGDAARARAQEQLDSAEEKGAAFWKAYGIMNLGSALALIGTSSRAIEVLSEGFSVARVTRATLWRPLHLAHLARAHADIGQFEAARRCIGEALTAAETSKETWYEAEVHRTAGDIELTSPAPNSAKAEAHFERALRVARSQQAKSWELRAATSLAQLWRHERKSDEARDLLTPIYGWFTEGFDMLDLKEAKALLDQLHG